MSIAPQDGMAPIVDHRDLDVWKQAMQLAEDVFEISGRFPPGEAYGLRSQLRRASASIPSNIAEGHSRGTSREFVRFLRIARGSLAETMTLLELSRRVGYLRPEELRGPLDLTERIGAMLTRLLQVMEARGGTRHLRR